MGRLTVIILLLISTSCSNNDVSIEIMSGVNQFNLDESSQAVVTGVSVTGEEGNYSFRVTLQSPDTGCEQYADWWEVFDVEQELVYRLTLGNSHVNDQPFSTIGFPVEIPQNQRVYIRGHMNNLGYGSLVFSGSVTEGFRRDTMNALASLERANPQPPECAF